MVTLDQPLDGRLVFEDGTATFTLRHGERVKARNLPKGTHYTVVELEANADGYTTTVRGESGEIVGNAAVSFVNDRGDIPEEPPVDPVPQTSDETDMALWMMVMAFSGVGLVAALVLSKRLNPKEKRTRHYKAKYYK